MLEKTEVSSTTDSLNLDFLQERIADVFEAAGADLFQTGGIGESTFWGNPPPGLSEHAAEIYFHYKLDQPRHFLLRAVRDGLLRPLLRRQVEYNLSLRGAVLRLWHERSELRHDLDNARRRIADLEKKVDALAAKITPSR